MIKQVQRLAIVIGSSKIQQLYLIFLVFALVNLTLLACFCSYPNYHLEICSRGKFT
ncbi:hypothetical protein LR48_Vigan238s000200 [Vigna angularis]|nr:hypothetical protein LR48_Vigan238s000200 [Vigna angularis]